MLCKPKKKKIPKSLMIGVDEAGRGALAGPVVASAVVIRTAKIKKNLVMVKDSKKLSPKKRKEIYEILKSLPEVNWGIGRVSEKLIDKINILKATKLAMKRAVKNLKSKIKNKKSKINFLLIDGNFGIDMPILQKLIIKGDEKIFLIKLASIVAKVTRDRTMIRYHQRYPQYCFDKHKGYGTKLHLERLKKYGPCKIHRKTFKPVQKFNSHTKQLK